MTSNLILFSHRAISFLKHAITYPISQGRLINIIGYISDFDAEGIKLSSADINLSASPEERSIYEKYGDPIPMFKERSKEEILRYFKEGEWEEDVISLFGVYVFYDTICVLFD